MLSNMQRPAAYLLRLSVVFGLYFAAGKIGLSAPFTNGNVSPFWPASGIALASVLLWGYRIWPAIAAAAFLVNFWSPIPTEAALGIAVGNTSAAVTGGFLLNRLGRLDLKLDSLRDVITLLALGALVSPIVAASMGTMTLSLTHVKAWSGFGTALPVWWFGDGLGVLIATPLFLKARQARLWSLQFGGVEVLSLFAATTVTSLLMFSQTLGQSVHDDVLAFAVFPFVIWAAIRFRLIGASITCFLIAMIAVWGTAHGNGPFVRHDPVRNAILLQSFLAVLCVTGLSLAAVISERARAEYALRNLSGHLIRLQDGERRRLARELHDSTGQLLVALQMNLAVVSQRVSQSDRESADLLLDSMGTLDRVVKEIRTLSYLLHPPLLDEAGLPSALQWYIDGLAQRSSLKVDLQISSDVGRLSQELETTIFRIVQECLTNIYRHSGSSVARIALITKRGHAILRIRDEGGGVHAQLLGDPAVNPSSFGVGLRGIAERVRELDGKVRIKNAVPGTIVEVILPLQRQDSAGTNEAPTKFKGQKQGA